jgi:hypothetical protein
MINKIMGIILNFTKFQMKFLYFISNFMFVYFASAKLIKSYIFLFFHKGIMVYLR